MKYLAVIVCLVLLMPIVCAKQTVGQEGPLSISAYSAQADAYSDRESIETLNWDWHTDGPVQFVLICKLTNKTYDFGNATRLTGSMKLGEGGTWFLVWKNYNNYSVGGYAKSWINNPNDDADEAGNQILFILATGTITGLVIAVIVLIWRRKKCQKKKISD